MFRIIPVSPTFTQWAFSVAGRLLVWNLLPDYLTNLRDSAVGRDTFRKHWKTFLFVVYWNIQHISSFTVTCSISLHFTYLFIYLRYAWSIAEWTTELMQHLTFNVDFSRVMRRPLPLLQLCVPVTDDERSTLWLHGVPWVHVVWQVNTFHFIADFVQLLSHGDHRALKVLEKIVLIFPGPGTSLKTA